MNRIVKKWTIFATALILGACGRAETMPELTRRVFSLAEVQLPAQSRQLDRKHIATTFQGDTLTLAKTTRWVSGFLPGSLWLTYEYTGNEAVKDAAWRETRKLRNLVSKKTHHDIGFQLMCSYGNAYRLTGDTACVRILRAGAEKLAGRFDPAVGLTKSWESGKRWDYPVIIDNMMNLELLTAWGDKDIAVAHARKTMREHFREDGTCYHLVDYNPDGSVRRKQTVQGAEDESAWARGQAWALYGYTMMFRETGEADFLAHAEKVARMLLEKLPEDGIPYWDFSRVGEERDASAAAIMASAFVELSGLTGDQPLSAACLAEAEKQLRMLASPAYLAGEGENGGFLLKHSVGNKPKGSEVDVPLTYADYYFLEALLRYRKYSE